MPAKAKPLFRPDALRPELSHFPYPADADAKTKLANWSALLDSANANELKESELLPDFITDVFGHQLGYVGPAGGYATYTLKREATIEVEGKIAVKVINHDGGSGEGVPGGEVKVSSL